MKLFTKLTTLTLLVTLCNFTVSFADEVPGPDILNSKLCLPMPSSGGFGQTSVTIKQFMTLFNDLENAHWEHPSTTQWIFRGEKMDATSGKPDEIVFAFVKVKEGLAVTQISSGNERLSDANKIHSMVANMIAPLAMQQSDDEHTGKNKKPKDKLSKVVGKYGNNATVEKASDDSVKINLESQCMKGINITKIAFKDQISKIDYSKADYGYVARFQDGDCDVKLTFDSNGNMVIKDMNPKKCCGGMLAGELGKK